MSRDNIHYLRLNESIKLTNGIEITRVPGYWIYMLPNGSSEKIEINSEFSKKGNTRITKEKVALMMADRLKLDAKFYLNKTTNKHKTRAKRILVKILYENLNLTHYEIAEFLEYVSHSGSVQSLQTTNAAIQTDARLKQDYQDILRLVLRYNSRIT